MPADYVTFQDDTITLKKGGDLDKDVKFDTPNVSTTGNASVEFCVTPTGSTTLTVEINGTDVVNQFFNSATGRVWRENFSGSILKKSNTMTVKKNADGEDIDLSDFIVHFKTG